MKVFALVSLLASAMAITACATVPDATVAASTDVCGRYGFVDANNDGFVSGDEWNAFRAGAYGGWDVNGDGRIDQTEFQNCYRAGGFYRSHYDPARWNNYWSAFDANGDGFLSPEEYWSAPAWTRLDRNGNGRIDDDEWTW